ncbi:MAG: response regulator transcription factor [Corynebacterium sp.]|nr:response regulator transcription factor [Corynebacterium sp.]
MSIRVLIADDQDLVRGALKVLLNLEPDIDVVAEVGNGTEVAAAVKKHNIDVALLDIEMPMMSGIEAAATLTDTDCAVIIVTTFDRPGYFQRALDAGVSGYVVKDTPPDELATAVRRVHHGLRVFDNHLVEEAQRAGNNPLTPREIEICNAAKDHASVAQIANRIFLSEGTVRNHLSNVMAKTGARNYHEAVHAAITKGWL